MHTGRPQITPGRRPRRSASGCRTRRSVSGHPGSLQVDGVTTGQVTPGHGHRSRSPPGHIPQVTQVTSAAGDPMVTHRPHRSQTGHIQGHHQATHSHRSTIGHTHVAPRMLAHMPTSQCRSPRDAGHQSPQGTGHPRYITGHTHRSRTRRHRSHTGQTRSHMGNGVTRTAPSPTTGPMLARNAYLRAMCRGDVHSVGSDWVRWAVVRWTMAAGVGGKARDAAVGCVGRTWWRVKRATVGSSGCRVVGTASLVSGSGKLEVIRTKGLLTCGCNHGMPC